jgi:hypothetical protein
LLSPSSRAFAGQAEATHPVFIFEHLHFPGEAGRKTMGLLEMVLGQAKADAAFAQRQSGREAMYASYDKHYQVAESQGRDEPIYFALYGALCTCYKFRGKFISEAVHTVELAPFFMMDRALGRECIADYALVQEIPGGIDNLPNTIHNLSAIQGALIAKDLGKLKVAINMALRQKSGPKAEDYYRLIVVSLPFLTTDVGILWTRWLDDDVVQKMIADVDQDGVPPGALLCATLIAGSPQSTDIS